MKVATLLYQNDCFVKEINSENISYNEVQLIIGFGAGNIIKSERVFFDIKAKFPNACISLCSSAGEIFGVKVYDNTVSLVALSFSSSYIKTSIVNIADSESSLEAGKKLVELLPKEKLKLIFVLSDGDKVNGSELVKGLNFNKTENILITGGIAGDGTNFEQTYVGLNDIPKSGNIIGIGFYGDKLKLSHGSFGGWDSFGLEREVTNSKSNVLFEVDNKNVLDLYKTYLGKYANQLPEAAMLFPISFTVTDKHEPVVRAVLSIDEMNQSMTFAGDIPTGSKVRFMKANFDKLIDAAGQAASNCLAVNSSYPKLAFLISCAARKIILSNRIEEELVTVSEIFDESTTLTGFYSYGEISPSKPFTECELHNQTITITGIDEIE